MVKLLIFAILLASPATGLIEKLFHVETNCYSGCHSSYPTSPANEAQLSACKQGCDFGFYGQNCATKCTSVPKDVQNSCQVGCTISGAATSGATAGKPNIAIEPRPVNEEPVVVAPANPEPERPRSIILIRLRQRPSFDMPSIQMPSVQRVFNDDPIQFFNNIIKQFQEKANSFEESVRQSIQKNSNELPKPSEFGAVQQLVHSIPMIRISGNVRADAAGESSEETHEKRPLIDEIKHVIQHPREHQQYFRERVQPVNNRVQQFFTDVRTEWNDLVRKQPKIPIWIFLCILLSSSAMLWYMVMSLCRHTPSRDALSIRAQELVFHPYEYDAYEKEKIQPDDQQYEVAESLPIKVKLTNI